jgi:multicomponent Na+:H+ antiporter subunit C
VQIESAILIGAMFAIATYLLLKKNFIHILFGFVILSNGANLFILAMSGDPGDRQPPVIIENSGPVVDPIPQALVLTAIVIGFGLTVYLIMLLYRIFLDTGNTDAESLFLPEEGDE